MSDTIDDNISTEDGVAMDKPAVRRRPFQFGQKVKWFMYDAVVIGGPSCSGQLKIKPDWQAGNPMPNWPVAERWVPVAQVNSSHGA